jgi:threonine dehydratase
MRPELIADPAAPWSLQPPSFAEIEEAAGRIAGHLVRTPLLESERVNRLVGGRLFVKAEGLQRTGSFKARGAWNVLSLLGAESRARGVLAFSSGNHGQAVAWAAHCFGVPAIIVMPSDAPATKILRTREWDAEVLLYDRRSEDREAIGRALAVERGLTVIPPFEDRRIIAGAGTVGLEVLEQAHDEGVVLDGFLVNCSGGGLAGGCAIAWHALAPAAAVWAVEPSTYDDMARSLAAGTRQSNDTAQVSICDALLAMTPGALTFAIARARLRGALTVSDDEVLAAMRLAFDEFRLVVEPGGAAALASVLSGRLNTRDRNLAVLLSGANVDASLFQRALESR